ncbi:MAG: sugar phosphate isomerase/epimerase [Acidobacteriales bacterium]|nr:sugar phosphate isomerase/epimerase [Terriglobales bacterium]
MLLGYNTNGFAHHRLDDALEILAELGCQSVAITLDYHVLNPFQPDLTLRLEQTQFLLEELKLASVIETGARFLLDPRRKHQPTLLSPRPEERQRRWDFLARAVDIAAQLGSGVVSFWSGATLEEDAKEEELWARLVEGCQRLAEYASFRNVRLAFEPEPGMFIDTMPRFTRLHALVQAPVFGLTLDLGHLHCQGETPMGPHIVQWKDWLWNVHLEDMKKGVHEHLAFGEGEIDFPPALTALKQVGYRGGLHVELSRHSADAVNTARGALAFLRGLLAKV